MGQLEDMAMFVRIVEAGAIGKAAEQLSLAKSAVSRRLTELERRLGTPLINRTTRKFSITEAGHNYYHRTLKLLEDIESLNADTSNTATKVEGTLKIAIPLTFGLMHMSPLLDKFCKRYGELKMQVDFADRRVDLVEEGFELALRIGDLKDSSLHAKKLCDISYAICASPAYLEQYGRPKHPKDLTTHSLLHYGNANQAQIAIVDSNNKSHKVEMQTKVKANNGDFLADMAINGHGIVFSPTFIVYQALRAKQLIPVLTDCHTQPTSAYAIYPHGRSLSRRARLFIDFIAEQFSATPYWDIIDG